MINRPNKKNVSIQQMLAALLDNQTVFPPVYLHLFSDLEGPDLEALRSVWPQVNPTRRYMLLEDLEDISDSDTLVSFDNIARMALDDSEPRARTVAIRLLWEASDARLVPKFIHMMHDDPDVNVRAAAASGLGKYIYLGEIEEIAENVLHETERHLLDVTSGQDETLVRRRALEALGFSGRKEVPPLIRKAYDTEDTDWLASALFAMGRSADQSWSPEVIRMLRYPKTNVQIEAIRAAGELALENARQPLLQMLENDPEDSEVRLAIIWSLSQIGGEDVRDTLEELMDETEDEEELVFLENALDNLSFTEDMDIFEMFDLSANAEDEETEEYDELSDFLMDEDDDENDEEAGNKDQSGPSSTKPDTKRHRHKKKH